MVLIITFVKRDFAVTAYKKNQGSPVKNTFGVLSAAITKNSLGDVIVW